MDLDLKGNSSDSDLSDNWTLLNCSDEDITSHGNGRGAASDEESFESYGIEKQLLPRRDEESDGISVISESDICDNTEVIPTLGNNISQESLKDRDIRIVQRSPKRRGRCHDSFSESDGCELVDIPTDLSLHPRKGRKSRNSGPFSINEVHSCDYVEELGAEPGMHPKDESCMRIYVHRPNDHINFILSILLALALAAVAGLGTGHFLGTKEVKMTPEETLYKLQMENQILRSQLQVLLREREYSRRHMELCAFPNGKNFNRSEYFYSKMTDNYLYFQKLMSFLNRSLIDSNIPILVSTDSLEKNIPGKSVRLGNYCNRFCISDQLSPLKQSRQNNVNLQSGKVDHVFVSTDPLEKNDLGKNVGFGNYYSSFKSNDQLPLLEQSRQNNVNLHSRKVDHVPKTVHDSIVIVSNPKQISESKSSAVDKECSDKAYHDKEAKNLILEMKSALSHGLELSDKLKEAISYLDVAFANWKKSDGATLETYKNDVEKNTLKGLKHILEDGGKAKKILSKTVDKLDSIKRKIFKNSNVQHFWKDFIFKKNNHLSGTNLFSDVDRDSFSNMHADHYQNNRAPKRSDSASSLGVIYGPHLPTSVCNIPNKTVCLKDTDNSEETNPGLSEEDLDIVSVEVVEDESTSPVGKESFNLIPLELHQVLSKRLSGSLQNKPKNKEISSERVFKSTKKTQSVGDMNRIKLPDQNPRQIHSQQGGRKISCDSEQEGYPSTQNDKYSEQKPPFEEHLKINSKEEEIGKSVENLKSEENSSKHASKLQLHKSTQMLSEQTASKYSEEKSSKISEEDSTKSQKKIKSKENSRKDPSKPRHVSKEEYRIKLKHNSKSGNEKNYNSENEKKQKLEEHKSSSKQSRKEKYIKDTKSEKKFKQKHESKSKEREFKRKDKFHHKKKHYESEKYNKKKSYEESQKHMDNFKEDKYFHKALKQGKKNDLKYLDQIAWLVDEHGQKFTNLTGEWLLKMNQARAKQREKTHRSDWVFDRAISRRLKREEDIERARWYFQRARSREICRVDPDSDWCKNREKKNSHKLDTSNSWKRKHDDYDHNRYQRDWKTKHPSRHWRGSGFVSHAFKAAMNFMKA